MAVTTPKVRKPRESKVNPAETKSQKFVRLANPRMRKAIKALNAVGNLATRNYEYSADQAAKIITALKEAVLKVERSYEGTADKGSDFSL